jgi:hypothetical protein
MNSSDVAGFRGPEPSSLLTSVSKSEADRSEAPMATTKSYTRVTSVAVGAAALLAIVLNLTLGDWVASLHLAIVIVFTIITLILAIHALLSAIARRRRRDDPPGHQGEYGLAA